MRARIALLSACLLTGATAAVAQPLSCALVASEVRERVREAGACRDDTPGTAAPKAAASTPSATVTMKLSDGTVVRIPREISSDINDGRKRPATHETAPPKSVPRAGASAPSRPAVRGAPSPASQKLKVPDLIGRSYADAGSALAEFEVDRIETASAAPAGEVLAQEPAPASVVLRGSTVSLQISDGSLAGAAGPITDTVSAPAAAPAAAPSPVAEPAPAAAAPAAQPTLQPAPRDRFSIAFPDNAALILGAGVLLGGLLGALLMRRWHLRRQWAAEVSTALEPAPYPHRQPVETALENEATPDFRFAARLEAGETTIEFAPVVDSDAVAIEQSSDQHA